MQTSIKSNDPSSLLEPLGEMVLGIQIVNCQANPARCEHEDGGDNLAYEGDGFLENVEDGDDGKNYANDVNDAHNIKV